jgi:hypothetical protein
LRGVVLAGCECCTVASPRSPLTSTPLGAKCGPVQALPSSRCLAACMPTSVPRRPTQVPGGQARGSRLALLLWPRLAGVRNGLGACRQTEQQRLQWFNGMRAAGQILKRVLERLMCARARWLMWSRRGATHTASVSAHRMVLRFNSLCTHSHAPLRTILNRLRFGWPGSAREPNQRRAG